MKVLSTFAWFGVIIVRMLEVSVFLHALDNELVTL